MTSRSARLARGWIAATFATTVAAASHVLAGGPAPHTLMVALSLALSGLLCVALAGKALSLPRLILGVAASQGTFHTLFTAAPSSSTAVVNHSGHMSHDAGEMAAMLANSAGAPFALTNSAALDHSMTAMWFGHAVACLLTILFLRFGETAAWRLLDALRLEILWVLAIAPLHTPAPKRLFTGPTSQLLPLPDLGIPLRAMRHRGPPLRIIAAL